MIAFMKNTPAGLESLESMVPNCWINLVDPGKDEIERVCKELEIPEDIVTYSLDLDEMARTQREDGIVLIVLRVPYREPEHDAPPFTTVPVGIVLTERAILTISKYPTEVISDLRAGRVRGLSTAKKNRFVLHLLMETATEYLYNLRVINRAVDALEDRLKMSLRNKEVLEMLRYQKSLTLFTTALKQNELMIARLQKSLLFDRFEEDSELLDDVLTEIHQAIEMTNIASGILSQMMDAFASIISNNLNVVMKFLASVTIIIALPTLVASIYGMNVDLPFQQHDFAFEIAMGVAAVFSLVVGVVFYRKDWL